MEAEEIGRERQSPAAVAAAGSRIEVMELMKVSDDGLIFLSPAGTFALAEVEEKAVEMAAK